MNDSWSDIEIEFTIADYFSMLNEELKGIKYNKSEHRRALVSHLNDRNEGAVEFKHQNISAILIEMGLPFIKGYKPMYNYQNQLAYKTHEYVRLHSNMDTTFYEFANDTPTIIKEPEFPIWIVPPPERREIIKEATTLRRPLKPNYLEIEQNNRHLGLKGEELALQYERYLLINAGKNALADKVEWVSKEQGDGLGFDILSRNLNGTDKYIEVKTTKLSKDTPFFFSSNEYDFSIEKGSNFHLYRIFDFKETPKMFTLTGRYDDFCQIEPTQYKGRF